MKEFQGKTAVITGAAHGFGLEFAKECARRGMNIALADMQKDALDAAVKTVTDMGAAAIGIHTDVSLYENVQAMVKTTMDRFGQIDLLFNNAGVYYHGTVWEVPARDFQWMVDINLLSMAYAMKEVIPIMINQGTDAHIVNIASVAGTMTSRTMAAYHATKHAALALSEATAMDLQRQAPNIKVSAFCPGYIKTSLDHSQEYRPERYKINDDPYYTSELSAKMAKILSKVIESGRPVDDVAAIVFKAIEEEQFYIMTHDEMTPWIQYRMDNILNRENPDANKKF